MASDLDLLAIEIETLWSRNERGRLMRERGPDAAPYVAVAVTPEGAVVALGAEIPNDLAEELVDVATGARASVTGEAPPEVHACASKLSAAMGPVELRSGLSYVAASTPVAPSPGALVIADALRPVTRAIDPPPGAGWRREEWRDLLDGKLGPWAISMADDEIAAICFCSRLTDRAAEAGLRTEPAYRRQGHGASATAAWAGLVLASGRIAFYSTSADNIASQRVAERLGFREIGWIWQVARPQRPNG